MTKQDLECAILFADIAGSTRLYQAIGDERAQASVAACLSRLSDIAATSSTAASIAAVQVS